MKTWQHCDFHFDHCILDASIFLTGKDNNLAISCVECYDRKISKFSFYRRISADRFQKLKTFE